MNIRKLWRSWGKVLNRMPGAFGFLGTDLLTVSYFCSPKWPNVHRGHFQLVLVFHMVKSCIHLDLLRWQLKIYESTSYGWNIPTNPYFYIFYIFSIFSSLFKYLEPPSFFLETIYSSNKVRKDITYHEHFNQLRIIIFFYRDMFNDRSSNEFIFPCFPRYFWSRVDNERTDYQLRRMQINTYYSIGGKQNKKNLIIRNFEATLKCI